MNPRLKAFIVNALRRASYRWPGRYMALKNAHIGRNEYFCAMCPEGVLHPKKNIQMDHRIPIVDPKIGWDGFNDAYMDRFFPEQDGWQVLCRECHEKKTDEENLIRSESRKKNKKT